MQAEAKNVEQSSERPIRILAVCGSGQGSSMMMKMKIKGYLDKRGIPNIMDSCTVTDYKGKLNEVDIIVSSKHLAGEIEVGEGKSVLGVQNMLNPNSFGDELVELINKHNSAPCENSYSNRKNAIATAAATNAAVAVKYG